MKKHKLCHCTECEKTRYWQPCKGCPEGHSSFWKTVVESPQWALWEKEQQKRFRFVGKKVAEDVFDIDECRECGIISPKHFQSFMKFCKRKQNV